MSLLNCVLLHCPGAIQHATAVSSAVEGLIHTMMLQNAEACILCTLHRRWHCPISVRDAVCRPTMHGPIINQKHGSWCLRQLQVNRSKPAYLRGKIIYPVWLCANPLRLLGTVQWTSTEYSCTCSSAMTMTSVCSCSATALRDQASPQKQQITMFKLGQSLRQLDILPSAQVQNC